MSSCPASALTQQHAGSSVTLHMENKSPDPAATWHVPLWEEKLTLRQAYDSLKLVGFPDTAMPLMIRLVENPKFKLGGLGYFKGRVTLEQHDMIHIVLGRGLLPIDEA